MQALAPNQTRLAADGQSAEKAEVQLQSLVLPQTSAGQQANHFELISKPTKTVQGSPLIPDVGKGTKWLACTANSTAGPLEIKTQSFVRPSPGQDGLCVQRDKL